MEAADAASQSLGVDPARVVPVALQDLVTS
jgi:hypothetical protein